MSDTLDRPTERASERLEELRERLREQASLFDDPGAYLAGVEDAIEKLSELDEPLPVALPWTHAGIRVTVADRPATRSDRARYLAALAVGLATAGRGHREIVDELIDAADGASDLLQQAARSVYALRVGEAEHRRTAEALLLQSVIEASPRV